MYTCVLISQKYNEDESYKTSTLSEITIHERDLINLEKIICEEIDYKIIIKKEQYKEYLKQIQGIIDKQDNKNKK